VNKSSGAWATELANYIIDCLTRDGKNQGYVNAERFVIQMNTGLIRNDEELSFKGSGSPEKGTGSYKYTGLSYQEKYTTSEDYLYNFEGRFETEVDGKKVSNFYLSKEVDGITKLYTIESSASLDGLDKRVITEVDINSTQGADAYDFFFGDGE
jgi:hypothetical protein